ncbi:hypothetical protein GALMADRAFT_138202 [Galerina marginata CBS 339.88]|uniref:Uncharacterized protein n=1 Tax=Galerina marginata (strain CBS 339.88) TaxID=685588 RepID=A0A067T4K4_GALM3|nr:hypothetical protein GALMADRAFT_138202 [Galerina marginata CBS 339.88]
MPDKKASRAPSSRRRRTSGPPIYHINVYGNFTYITNANSHNVATSTSTETTNDRSMVVLKAESITHCSSLCGRHFSQSESDPSSSSGFDEEEEDNKAAFDSEASQECRNHTHVEAEVQTEPWVIDLDQLFSPARGKKP